jgi:hypothetical protein
MDLFFLSVMLIFLMPLSFSLIFSSLQLIISSQLNHLLNQQLFSTQHQLWIHLEISPDSHHLTEIWWRDERRRFHGKES